MQRFQPELIQNPFEILVGIKQEGSVREFNEQFKMYSRPLKITEWRYLLRLFLNGLKDEVRAELKLHSFHTLEQLMNLAKMVESRNNLLHKNSGRVGNRLSDFQGPTRLGGSPLLARNSGMASNALSSNGG